MNKTEINDERRVLSRQRRRLQQISRAFGIDASGGTSQLRGVLRRLKDRILLKDFYQDISTNLRNRNSYSCTPTHAEDQFFERFTKQSKFQILRQVWVGNLSMDHFIPGMGLRRPEGRGFSHRGIAFEIDGSSHFTEAKMKKDQFKEVYLNDQGIFLLRIPNWDVSSMLLPTPATEVRFRTVDSRARRQVWGMIHLATVLAHGTSAMILRLFQPRHRSLLEEVL